MEGGERDTMDWRILSYLLGRSVRTSASDRCEVGGEFWLDASVLHDPVAKFRAFVASVEDAPGDALMIPVPAWICRMLADRFQLFVDFVDEGGRDYATALAGSLGLHGRGRGHRVASSKVKRRQLAMAMAVAWLIYASETQGDPMEAREAAERIDAEMAVEFPDEKGWSRSSLLRAWASYGDESMSVVRTLNGEGKLGLPRQFNREDWPRITELANR